MSGTVQCRICSAKAEYFGSTQVLRRYQVKYYRCPECDFVQTEDPYWLEEAYAEAINDCDVGLVERNLDISRKSTAILLPFFDCNAKFLDYGGGYGLLVRLMRDAGFDFYRYDKHCKNVFAQGFEAQLCDGEPYELVSAFELFEHLEHPLDEIGKMMAFSRNILFTTQLMPSTFPRPGEWWYYIPDHGQHIAFYTRKTLQTIANKLSLNLYSDGRFFHLLTEKPLPFSLLFRIFSRKRIAALIAALNWRQSLVFDDYRKITGKDFS